MLFSFSACSLCVAFVGFGSLSDLTPEGVVNEALRLVIFVGPILSYPRYAERARVLVFLQINTPHRNALWFLPVTGFFVICWYLFAENWLLVVHVPHPRFE